MNNPSTPLPEADIVLNTDDADKQVIRENGPNLQTENVLMRWDRQIETPYAELSEQEKQSDREQVDRYLPLINLYIEERERLAYGRGTIDTLDHVKAWADKTEVTYNDMMSDRIKELE